MVKPNALILRTAGTNCDFETQAAFELAGANAKRVHINSLISGETRLDRFQIMAIPGGFSYGDDIASGKILANELKYKLGDIIREFAVSGKPMIGICNGFQVLVKTGILPDESSMKQTVTLTFNDSDKFECRWVNLKKERGTRKGGAVCLWSKNLPDVMRFPVAHGEGKFITRDSRILRDIEKNGQVVFRYCDDKGKNAGYPFNPNGSVNRIAGICNSKGNILGLMPHPERAVYSWQHAVKRGLSSRDGYGWGLQIFRNAVEYLK